MASFLLDALSGRYAKPKASLGDDSYSIPNAAPATAGPVLYDKATSLGEAAITSAAEGAIGYGIVLAGAPFVGYFFMGDALGGFLLRLSKGQ
jgi:hypothetical protein